MGQRQRVNGGLAQRAGRCSVGNKQVHGSIVLHGCHNPGMLKFPYELRIGWRYTRAGRTTRRNGFISFISGVSMLGIALGVAALIIVLSVMNGFQKEVRDRMLGVVSHIEVYAPGGQALPDVNLTLSAGAGPPAGFGCCTFYSSPGLYGEG
jgi:lipoprotein-releasing system permease protein